MIWSIPITPQRSTDPLTSEQLAPPAPAPAAEPRVTSAQISARIAACRACEHVARGGQTCAACDIRCAYPLAAERPPLLAVPESICPAGRWPVSP
jgi:hypothetical protein